MVAGDVTVVGIVDMLPSASVRSSNCRSMSSTSFWICVMRSVEESDRLPARTDDSIEAPKTEKDRRISSDSSLSGDCGAHSTERTTCMHNEVENNTARVMVNWTDRRAVTMYGMSI